MKILCRILLLASLAAAASTQAEQSGRPHDLTLANFQFGPENRWAFSHFREVMATANIPSDNSRVLQLPTQDQATEDFSLPFQGRQQRISAIATDQYLDGVLVIRNGSIVAEHYFGQLRAERPHLMMSVTKSVIGLLAGAIAADGKIDLQKPVKDYVPELAASGWGGDSLQTLLDMRDGADYTEDYTDFTSTVRLQDCAAGWTDADYCPPDGPRGGYEFFPTVGRNEANLGKFVYKSGSTDVIGWVLEEATQMPIAQLISERIWQPMGAEFDAYISVDSGGFALSDGGMSATLRDLGRLGLLVLNGGKAFGEQVIPADFIKDIHEQPGDPDWPYAGSPDDWAPYYRSFWWGQGNQSRDIVGVGINGQFLQVAPDDDIVVVLYSSWPLADGDDERDYWGDLYALGSALVAKFR